MIRKETKDEFVRKWTERINTFTQLRSNLPEIYQENLTSATSMLQTLVQVTADRIFG